VCIGHIIIFGRRSIGCKKKRMHSRPLARPMNTVCVHRLPMWGLICTYIYIYTKCFIIHKMCLYYVCISIKGTFVRTAKSTI
jgi:hypothetical protein